MSLHLIHLGLKTFGEDTNLYTHYNNYVIFKQSYQHLIESKDLYQWYPKEQWDLYKYSPTFSLIMAPFYYMPDWLGLSIWSLINILVFFFALWKFPFPDERKKILALGFTFIELTTAILNAQTNALIAGLLVLAFVLLENKQQFLAVLFITITVYVKIFGVLAFSLLLLYPERWRAFLYSVFWMLLFGLLPLLVVPLHQYEFLIRSWSHLLQDDHSTSYGFSVIGWLHTWFGLDPNKMLVVLAGGILFCIPLLKLKSYGEPLFRILLLCSVLIWVIIFNHKAESATFIIAVTGIALWFFSKSKATDFDLALIISVFILTVLSPTDLFPRYLREHIVSPYVLKGFPCILVWGKIVWEQLTMKPVLT